MVTNASSQTQLQILTLVGLHFMYAMNLKAEATRRSMVEKEHESTGLQWRDNYPAANRQPVRYSCQF